MMICVGRLSYFRVLVCLGSGAGSRTSFVELRPERRPWNWAQNTVDEVIAARLLDVGAVFCTVIEGPLIVLSSLDRTRTVVAESLRRLASVGPVLVLLSSVLSSMLLFEEPADCRTVSVSWVDILWIVSFFLPCNFCVLHILLLLDRKGVSVFSCLSV